MHEENLRPHFPGTPNPGKRAAVRFLIFSILWWMLSCDATSLIVGIPAVILAVYISLLLTPNPSRPLNLIGVLYFLPFFLRQSLHSGIDVMRRALSPGLPINPGLVPYATYLPEGTPRILFVNTISLLPGTLSADLNKNTVTVHTIDRDLPVWAHIQNLEWRIAALFNITPPGKEKP